jgi:predicted P-loop ATPase
MLSDPTGNRRFLPVECGGNPCKSVHDMTDYDVQQIWGEAVHWYRGGEKPLLTQDVEKSAESVRDTHTDLGMITEEIVAFLDKPITADWYKLSLATRQSRMIQPDGMCVVRRDFISSREIWRECFSGETPSVPYDMRSQISSAMAYLRSKGWTRAFKRIGREYGEDSVTGLSREV